MSEESTLQPVFLAPFDQVIFLLEHQVNARAILLLQLFSLGCDD
jgi:hypothetical protein